MLTVISAILDAVKYGAELPLIGLNTRAVKFIHVS